MNNASYLSNICILKRVYEYKNVCIITALFADADFKPKIVVVDNEQEFVSFDLNEFNYYFSQSRLQDQFNFLYCSKYCSIDVIPQLMEVLARYSICIHLYLKYLSSLDNDVKSSLKHFDNLIKIHTLLPPDEIYKILIDNCDVNSILEHEMISIGFDFFLPNIIFKTGSCCEL